MANSTSQGATVSPDHKHGHSSRWRSFSTGTKHKVLSLPKLSPRRRPRSAHGYNLSNASTSVRELTSTSSDISSLCRPQSQQQLLAIKPSTNANYPQLQDNTTGYNATDYRSRSSTLPSRSFQQQHSANPQRASVYSVPSPLSPMSSHVSSDSEVHSDKFKFLSASEPSETPAPSTDYKLSSFASSFSRQFPLNVVATKGFCSNSGEVSISHGEEFWLHFVKHTKVVTMKDSAGVTYSIPLNTSLKFGIIYDPYGNDKMALNGFYYRTVAEILALRKLPKIVCATKPYAGGNQESSVSEGEILVITGIKNTIHGRVLKVQSLTNGRKYLHERCTAIFSTKPTNIAIPLPAVFQYMIPFPQKALLLPERDIARTFPPHFLKTPVTLKQCSIETSIVATSPALEATQSEFLAIDLPTDLDTEVRIANVPRYVRTRLQQKTDEMLKNFDPSTLYTYADMETSESYQIQSVLYTSINNDYKMYGVQIVRPDLSIEDCSSSPENMSTTIESDFFESQETLSQITTGEELSESVESCKKDKLERRLEQVETNYKTLEGQAVQMSQDIQGLASRLDQLSDSMKNTTRLTQGLESIGVTDKLMSWCMLMQEDIQQLQEQASSARLPGLAVSTHKSAPNSPLLSRKHNH